jgi:hypothetical protein
MADNLIPDTPKDHEQHQSNENKSKKESKSVAERDIAGRRSSEQHEKQQDPNDEVFFTRGGCGPAGYSPKPRNGSCGDISSGKLFHVASKSTSSPKSSKGSFYFGSSNNNGSPSAYSSSTSNFQFNQVPVSYNIPSRRGSSSSKSRDHFVLGSNSSYHQTRGTFMERFRSQTSIPESISDSSKGTKNNGNSKSVHTSPVDLIPPPSPCSTKSSIGGHSVNSSGHYSNYTNGQRTSKPKKWFSFTNLLNRQNLSGLLNIPKSRLSVSSTLNSVFVGPISPTPSGSESCPGVGSTGSSSAFFGGITNFGFEKTSSNSSSFGQGDPLLNHPSSPTLSNATVSGDPSYRNLFGLGDSPGLGQVVYRNKNKGGNISGGGRRDRGSNSATSSVVASSPGANGVVSYSSGKHYSSGGSSGCGGGNSESASERSSGVGYYTGYSSGGSVGIPNNYGSGIGGGGGGPGSSSGGGGSRLSCGEFFTGTPNSPICSGETPTEFHQFQFNSGHSSSGFGSREGDASSSSSSAATAAAAFYSYHKTLGRSLPTLLGKLSDRKDVPVSYFLFKSKQRKAFPRGYNIGNLIEFFV